MIYFIIGVIVGVYYQKNAQRKERGGYIRSFYPLKNK